MKRSSGFRMILTAMLASMVCVSTICIQIASPMGGYIHLGDALVLMSAFLLGPAYGAAAAGLGSALADVLTGYIHFAPGTLIIKGCVALAAALLLSRMKKRPVPGPLQLVSAAVPAEIIMILGYLVYEWFFMSYGAGALSSIPGNLVQAAAGILISALLTPVVMRPREIQEMLENFHRKNK